MNIKSQVFYLLVFTSSLISAQSNCDIDTIPPNIECLSSIFISLQEEDQLFSRDFVISATDNCTNNDNELLISFAPDTIIYSYSYGPFPDACDDVMGVDLTNVPLLSQDSVTVYVSDKSGNTSSCKTEITEVVIDEGDCIIDYDVYLTIFDVNQNVTFERLPRIEVLVTDYETESTDSTFFVTPERQGNRYKYSPSVFSDRVIIEPIEFISVFLEFEPLTSQYITVTDLLLIQNHILGLNSFEEEWQFVAADVNSDNNVNVLDLLVLRNIILGNSNVNEIPSHKIISDVNNLLNDDGFTATRFADLTKDLKYTLVRIGDLNDQSN